MDTLVITEGSVTLTRIFYSKLKKYIQQSRYPEKHAQHCFGLLAAQRQSFLLKAI